MFFWIIAIFVVLIGSNFFATMFLLYILDVVFCVENRKIIIGSSVFSMLVGGPILILSSPLIMITILISIVVTKIVD
jgi:hypothetical protein